MRCIYHVIKAVQTVKKIPTVVGNIAVVGALTHCVFLHSVCDLKAIQMNVQHCLILEHVL